jgi:regulator of nucleoside diphosphate kinase
MFVSSHPPSIAMTVRDMDALRSLMRTSNLQSEVAEFVAHELGRADRIEAARSMLDYVTIGSWVLFRLDRSGDVRFTKLELPNAGPTSTTRTSVTTAIGAALIGLRQDQSIEWRMRDERRVERLTVLMILPARPWPPLLSA